MSRLAPARKKKPPFPWLLCLVFLGTVYLFWILPLQLGPRPVRVDFVPGGGKSGR